MAPLRVITKRPLSSRCSEDQFPELALRTIDRRLVSVAAKLASLSNTTLVGDNTFANKPHGKRLWFPILARNKKSVTLNAREKEGQALIRDLVAKSDILLENFRPGTMER